MKVTRRTFVTTLGSAGVAAGAAAPALASGEAPHVSPKRHRPVRATHAGLPYFDFTGRTAAYRPERAKKLDEAHLTHEQRWLLGLF